MARPIRLLTFSTLYPNAAQPGHGIFVETRLRRLLQVPEVESRVVAPVPWFPSSNARFGRYAEYAQAPDHEERFSIRVSHPRYPVVPKVGMSLAPALLYACTLPHVRRIVRAGYDFDVIDAHYFYPDGVAAVLLGRTLGKAVTVTARGSDINMCARFPLPRRMIAWAAANADGVTTVSRALKDQLVRLGHEEARIRVLRNGVDLGMFTPGDKAAARAGLAVPARIIASVGNLMAVKRHDLVIRALASVDDATLLIVGKGPQESRLREMVRQLNLESRVRFLGFVPHESLANVYNAADVLVLASSREGWPNVLLEAMACGTPVIATNVGGTPEIVTSPHAGVLVDAATADAIAAAARRLLADPPCRTDTRRHAERFSWDETTRGQIDVFKGILARRSGTRRRHRSQSS